MQIKKSPRFYLPKPGALRTAPPPPKNCSTAMYVSISDIAIAPRGPPTRAFEGGPHTFALRVIPAMRSASCLPRAGKPTFARRLRSGNDKWFPRPLEIELADRSNGRRREISVFPGKRVPGEGDCYEPK